MQQRRLYISMITSLDGYIEDEHRKIDWFLDENAQFGRYCDEMIDAVGAAVFGRGSYELMADYWPKAEGEFAAKMNALPKVVLSRTLERATWANTRIARDVDAIAALKREPGKPIVGWAGAGMVESLMQARLVDELRLVVHPIALGRGTPMFRSPARLRQVRTQDLGGELSILCYEPIWS